METQNTILHSALIDAITKYNAKATTSLLSAFAVIKCAKYEDITPALKALQTGKYEGEIAYTNDFFGIYRKSSAKGLKCAVDFFSRKDTNSNIIIEGQSDGIHVYFTMQIK